MQKPCCNPECVKDTPYQPLLVAEGDSRLQKLVGGNLSQEDTAEISQEDPEPGRWVQKLVEETPNLENTWELYVKGALEFHGCGGQLIYLKGVRLSSLLRRYECF